jgi:hypothetical protein
MVDHADLDTIRVIPTHIVNVFNREAHHAMTLKKIDI